MGACGVTEIRGLLRDASISELPALIEDFADDARSGVQAVVTAARRRLATHEADVMRVRGMMAIQLQLHGTGIAVVAGVDEVGRGALAGPITAAAVVLDAGTYIAGLDDSKRVTPDARVRIAEKIRESALAHAVCHIPAQIIDAHGIVAANRQAMCGAIASLSTPVEHTIADGLPQDLGLPATFVVGGDRRCACVAAASILAKVSRDELMRGLAATYPGYGLDANKGYGTAEHVAAISNLGPSPIHRLSFHPCAQESLF